MMETISEEFAREILSFIGNGIDMLHSKWVELVIGSWKQKGYIKQSREEEIKQKLKTGYTVILGNNDNKSLLKYIGMQRELIEILDNKLKNEDV